MNLIRTSIERPIAIIAAVLMVVLFGIISLQTIPIQLTPDVRKPVLQVRTSWAGAAPAEVEREIVNRQEEVLRGLEGLDEMTSRSQRGSGRVTLEFSIGTDMNKALLLVSNRLDRISGYPDEANTPTLNTSDSDDRPVAWFSLLKTDGNTRDIHTYGDFIEDVIQDRIERVPGVAGMNIYGGGKRRMEVVIDPHRLAYFGLTVPEVVGALRSADASTSAGEVNEGKRRYVVRAEGDLNSAKDVAGVILRSQTDAASGRVSRVSVGDVADVRFDYPDATATIRNMGRPTLGMNALRENGANVIETMEGIRAAVDELNAGPLPEAGLFLQLTYDETIYINSAIDLVQQNIWVGGILAALVLLLFLRSGPATVIISLAIPVSVIGSFVAMAAMGRSINVISLAGIAFAVGMVVDAAIVVLENIFRLRQDGKSPREAAYLGASQVWGAVLVSALTTVLVFAPILIMKLEVGQLFRDIAVAISVAVLLSLVVAVTVIPALANRLLKGDMPVSGMRRLPIIDDLAKRFTNHTVRFAQSMARSPQKAILTVLLTTVITGTISWVMLPEREYLPEGNRNMVFGRIIPPPGYNLDTTSEIASGIEGAVRHLWRKDGTEPTRVEGGPPMMETFFFIARNDWAIVVASSAEPARAAELIPVLREPVFKEPGTFGFITQPSLFGRTVGGGRAVNLDISGPDLAEVLEVAVRATGLTSDILPREQGHQVRPRPGLELGAPEVRVLPDPVRLADNGVTAQTFAQTLDAFNDGLRVSEITVGGKRIDLVLKGDVGQITETQGIGSLPVVTASGAIVPVSTLADILVTSGPTEIRHIERQRTVTLQIRPSTDMPLDTAMTIIEEQIIAPLKAEGLPDGVRMRLAGTADKLTQASDALVLNLVIALIIVYLVMAVLFESFLYPLIILFSVPLATAGGVLALGLMGVFTNQQLDMLTMLGFIILTGIVVNNAILLVHQTLYLQRKEEVGLEDAIAQATRGRIRPIFMSTLTSVFGMLPLVLFPGAGSELYRGLGSVVVGGLSLSAVLTLLIIPPLLALAGRFEQRKIK